MTAAPADELRRLLASVGWRLWWGRLLQRLLAVAAGAAGGASLLLLARRAFPAFEDLRLPAALLAGGCVAAILPALRPVAVARAAALLDRACGLDERFSTALGCLPGDGAMARLVVRDAARLTRSLDVGRLPRPPLARRGWLAAALAFVAALLWLEPGAAREGGPAPAVGAPAIVRADASKAAGPVTPGTPWRDAPRAPSDAASHEGRELLRALGLDAPARAPGPAESARPAAATLTRAAGDPRRDVGAPLEATATPADAAAAAGAGAGAAGDAARSPLTGSAGAPRAEGVAAARGSGGGPQEISVGVAAPGGGGVDETAGRARADDEARAQPIPAAAAAGGALGREPVPPALRRYIIRYFEILRATPAGG